jgi:hypothetical protein
VSKQSWLIFSIVQVVGCILAGYGTVYSESTFVRGSWLCGFLLLLPGNLPAMALSQTLVHVRAAYIFFPVVVACNATLWVTSSAVWRMLRRARWSTPDKYGIALAQTGLVFAVANTIHFLRRVTCYDSFFPYGLPFTFYRDGGEGGGAGLELRGLAADAAVVMVSAVLLDGLWQWLGAIRSEQSTLFSIGEKVRREKALDFGGCNSRPRSLSADV